MDPEIPPHHPLVGSHLPEGAFQPEQRESFLLARIAEIFRDTGCGMEPILRSKIEPAPHLAEQRIAMIDDSLFVIGSMVPALVAATNGNTAAVRYTGLRYPEEIAASLVEFGPTVILVDYFLADTVRGPDLVPALRRQLPDAILLGYSSHNEIDTISEFVGAGADRFVHKSHSTADDIRNLDAAVAQILRERALEG